MIKKENKATILKLVFGLMFSIIIIINLKDYIEYKSVMTESNPISYIYTDKRINKGGRGDSYEMDYKYFNIKGTVYITSKEFFLIEKGIFPELFYSKKNGLIFSRWEIKKSIRITVLFLVFFIVVVFPWSRFKVF
jgi:hypothetical protein